MVSINEESDEDFILEITSQVEEVTATRIINIDQTTERASLLEGNIENLSSVIKGDRTIDSEDAVELRCIKITVVDYNNPLE